MCLVALVILGIDSVQPNRSPQLVCNFNFKDVTYHHGRFLVTGIKVPSCFQQRLVFEAKSPSNTSLSMAYNKENFDDATEV